MIFILVSMYLMLGLLANVLSAHRHVRPAARLFALLGWPWLVWIEGTPRMADFIEWAQCKED